MYMHSVHLFWWLGIQHITFCPCKQRLPRINMEPKLGICMLQDSQKRRNCTQITCICMTMPKIYLFHSCDSFGSVRSLGRNVLFCLIDIVFNLLAVLCKEFHPVWWNCGNLCITVMRMVVLVDRCSYHYHESFSLSEMENDLNVLDQHFLNCELQAFLFLRCSVAILE